MPKIYFYSLFFVIIILFSCKKSSIKGKATIPQDGLIAYFPFDGNTEDASTKKNNGKPTNVSYTTDRRGENGKAIKFGGFNNRGYVQVPNNESLKLSKQLTISLWLRLDDWGGMDDYGNFVQNKGWHSIICKDGDRVGWDLIIQGGGTLNVFNPVFSNNHFTDPKVYLTYEKNDENLLKKWVHIAYTIDGETVKLFLNGVLVTKELNFTVNFDRANQSDLMFGNFGNNGGVNPYFWYPLNGAIDEARLYNKALSDTEIAQIYEIEK